MRPRVAGLVRSRVGPEKKHFQQVPRQCCCWPGHFRVCCLRLLAPKGSASPLPERPSPPVVLVQTLPSSVNFFNWGLLLSKERFPSKDAEKRNLWCFISKQRNVSGRGCLESSNGSITVKTATGRSRCVWGRQGLRAAAPEMTSRFTGVVLCASQQHKASSLVLAESQWNGLECTDTDLRSVSWNIIALVLMSVWKGCLVNKWYWAI